MHELLSENQNENQEKINLEKLNFEELQQLSKEVTELAKTTFTETEDGFQNVNGKKILIKEIYDKYTIAGIDSRLADFHRYILHESDGKLEKGFDDKEELIQEIRKMIEETGNRIVE